LIDLLTDPGEMRNAIGDPEHQRILEHLRTELSDVFS
jgi:hypothetical protein